MVGAAAAAPTEWRRRPALPPKAAVAQLVAAPPHLTSCPRCVVRLLHAGRHSRCCTPGGRWVGLSRTGLLSGQHSHRQESFQWCTRHALHS